MTEFRCEHCERDFTSAPDKTGYEQAPCPSCGYLCMTVDFIEQERSRNRLPVARLLAPQFTLRTLLLVITILSVFFGLSVVTRSAYCNVATQVWVYGFPFPAVILAYDGMPISLDAIGLLKDTIAFLAILFIASRAWTWIASLKRPRREDHTINTLPS